MIIFSHTATRLRYIFTATSFLFVAANPFFVSVPSSASSRNVVQPNFLGISFELSYMNEYFGNDTSTIPSTTINYLSAIRERTGGKPLRLRIGGNSMDSSTYDPRMSSPMLRLMKNAANDDNQPATYGPMLFDVLKKVSDQLNGVQYLIGLPLLNLTDPAVPILAGDAAKKLDTSFDGYLLGNEPDLYGPHQRRSNIKNYTIGDYIKEFRSVSDRLRNASAGNLLHPKNVGGPTICCAWDLADILKSGYLSQFSDILKYISLQHYPQNNCFGTYQYGIDYYMKHTNVVKLAAWQQAGISIVQSNDSASRPQLVMSEFNSASCGGIPNISDTFAVGSLWTIDYALQMASVGYNAAHLHTRERGITYNLFAPPEGPNDNNGPWKTNAPYYALIATAEVLNSDDNGEASIVIDLNINNSTIDQGTSVAGYAVYNAKGASVQRFVLFNYANTTDAAATFMLPASSSNNTTKDVIVKYLSAQSYTEKTDIAWGGQTLSGVGDGILRDSTSSWAVPNRNVRCSDGCSIDVPPATMAVVFVAGTEGSITVQHTSPSSSQSLSSSLGFLVVVYACVLGFLFTV